MGKKDPRVDAFITDSAGFAQPLLKHLRKLVHQACPEADETIKWRMPFFQYKGLLCGMAAFKQHVAFVFWRDVKGVVGKNKADVEKAMGQLGRITSRADLPSDAVLLGYLRQAVALRDSGKSPKPSAAKAKAKPAPAVPPELKAALAKNQKAAETFAAFAPSHRREYIDWITDAKREETRQRRIATAIEWLSEGKSQNWRYETKASGRQKT